MCKRTTTEFEIVVSGGRIIIDNLPLKDGRYKVIAEAMLPEGIDAFVKVEASKLSLDDEFMKYQPEVKAQEFKKMLEAVIKKGIKDFWCPIFAPSYNESGDGICYKPGMKAALRNTYNWWEKVAMEFNPERRSRLGTKCEYIAFLAILIKDLVESGWEIPDAWNAVCNDSVKLGHYWNSKDYTPGGKLTGHNEVCGFYDLANARKILAEPKGRFFQKKRFWLASGYYKDTSSIRPLANLCPSSSFDFVLYDSIGWIVMEED